MQDLDVKKKILDEIMGLMDEKDGDRLKNHPKLIAAKLEIGKPKDEELLEDPKAEILESPLEEKKEDELDPESIQKLLEMYKGMK